jgi:LacI family transcriptional regulator
LEITLMTVTMRDVAKKAGVSLATVGRALNGRPVRSSTAEKINTAVAEIGYKPNIYAIRLNASGRRRFLVYIPDAQNLFVQILCDKVLENAAELRRLGIEVELVRYDQSRCDDFSNELRKSGLDVDGIVVMAPSHPAITEAINDLASSGKHVVTLVSDQPSSRRAGFAGVDNLAAGRTGGDLIGRMLGARVGPILCVMPTFHILDHIERAAGFQQVLSDAYPDLRVVEFRCPDMSREDASVPISPDQAAVYIADALNETGPVAGVYSTGGNTRAIATALTASSKGMRPLFVGSDLTPVSRRLLAEGVMDAVIEQSPATQARRALDMLVSLSDGETPESGSGSDNVQIIMRFNLPVIR